MSQNRNPQTFVTRVWFVCEETLVQLVKLNHLECLQAEVSWGDGVCVCVCFGNRLLFALVPFCFSEVQLHQIRPTHR